MAGMTPTRRGQLERLLEAAVGEGFSNESTDPKEEALVHTLLSICTRRSLAASDIDLLDGLCCSRGDLGDFTDPLIHICARATGITQSLALQALKTWCEDHEDCIEKCIQADVIPLLLSILATSLPVASQGTSAAYTSSMAVVLLRTLVRHGGNKGATSFLQASGVETLLQLVSDPSLDKRSLCLVLYLINDTTRRSAAILDQTIGSGAVPLIVSVLRQFPSEATKFAALILNRWSLAAQHLPAIREAGSLDALLEVLIVCCTTQSQNVDPNTAAYALSAVAIITQDAVADTRARLLASPAALSAISRAVAHYESCFQGVGFPHAMLSLLLDGPDGAEVVVALAAAGLLPAWLAARHVGPQLVERASQEDVTTALSQLHNPSDILEATISITHLVQHSPNFVSAILANGRLETLAQGALEELGAMGADNIASLPSYQSADLLASCEEAQMWNGEYPGAEADVGGADEDTCMLDVALRDVAAASDPCTGAKEDPGPELPLDLASPRSSAPLHRAPAPAVPTLSRPMACNALDARRCARALARLARLSSPQQTCECTSGGCSRKRGRNGELLEQTIAAAAIAGAFRKEDVGVARYDTLCFVVGTEEVHAVGFVLESHSTFLRGLLSTLRNVGERVAVPQLAQFSPADMHRLFLWAVEWCYTGHVEDMSESGLHAAFDLWDLAEFLQMDGLQRYCERSMEACFASHPIVLTRCLKLAAEYPSAAPLRTLVARHVLSFMVGLEHETGSEAMMAAHVAAHVAPLAGEVAEVMRSQLVSAIA